MYDGDNGKRRDKMINKLAFVTSIVIASVAAYFSIIGLSTIFYGAFWSVVIMASALEVGKLVTAAWLHLEWERVSIPIKTYLSSAVVVLMLITSMGIFGYLSKAHLEQETKTSNVDVQLAQVEQRIGTEQKRLQAIDTQLGALDKALDEYIERGFISRGLKAREEQKPERKELEAAREEINETINGLQEQALVLRKENIVLESEIGAIKYIAELVYGDEAKGYYDQAVRGVILSLVFVFDPLAVVLLIASTKAIATRREETPQTVKTKEVLIMEDIQKEDTPVEPKQPPRKKPAKWLKGAMATTRGWVNEKGELLKSQKMTQDEVDRLNNESV